MKKVISLFTLLVMLVSLFVAPMQISAVQEMSGKLANGVKWNLESNGTLRMSGEGRITYLANAPWMAEKENIYKLVIEEGITAIEGGTFSGLENLTEIYLPSTITGIFENAFGNNPSIARIYINLSEEEWKNNVSVDRMQDKTFNFATKYFVIKADTILVLTIGETQATINGEIVENDVAPIIVGERTMLPARFIAESLGASVEWVGEKNQVVIKGERTIVLTIGDNKAMIGDEVVILDAAPFIKNERTYTPVRFIAESLGASVGWYAEKQQVSIIK